MKFRKLMFAAALMAFFGLGVALTQTIPALANPDDAVIVVTTTDDEYDKTGTGNGCALREAIQAANTDQAFGGCPKGNGTDTIQLSTGVYKITRTGDAKSPYAGNFYITTSMNIVGNGSANTTVDGNQTDRVFNIESGTVNLRRLGVRNGKVGQTYGGGVYVGETATVLLDEVIVHHSTAADNGGGIGVEGNLTINKSLIYSNSSQQLGGGIETHYDGKLTIINSSIFDNTAKTAGGGLYNSGSGDTTIIGTTFSGNTVTAADSDGGGMVHTGGTMNLINSTISGNHANTDGGGIRNSAQLNLFNVTVTNNYADADHNNTGTGGGLYTFVSVNLENTILARNWNQQANGTMIDNCDGQAITSAGYNLLGTLACELQGDTTGNILGLDPQLTSLANFGGFTLTHSLKSNSPAIDAGNPNGCKGAGSTALTTDQRGAARPVDGNGGGGATCDIGAFEYAAVVPTNTPQPTATFTATATRTATATQTATATVVGCTGKPAKPNLTAPKNNKNVNKLRVKLKWDAVACAIKYKVIVRQGATNGPAVHKAKVTVTNFKTDPLAQGQSYFWRVKACNPNGCSKSQWSQFTVKP